MVESILLTTTRVSTFLGAHLLTAASGFFFERDARLFLVTSRHVLFDQPTAHLPDRIEIPIHLDAHDLTRIATVSLDLYRDGRGVWRQGRDQGGEVDVAVIEIDRTLLPASAQLRCFRPDHLQRSLEELEVGTTAADRRLPSRLLRHGSPSARRPAGGHRLLVRRPLPGRGMLPHRRAHAPRDERCAGRAARRRAAGSSVEAPRSALVDARHAHARPADRRRRSASTSRGTRTC